MRLSHNRLLATLVSMSVISVACAGRIPLPEQYAAADLAELETRMRAARVPESAYTAEVRLSYFGPEGRVKTTASLAVKRPASLRYEVQGPHGGVLAAFATNGRQAQLWDLKSSQFFCGPATAENLDDMLGIARLGLTPENWVALLFGEVPVPSDAVLTYDDREGLFALDWSGHRVLVNPETARVVRASIWNDEQQESHIEVNARDAHGLAVSLRLRAKAKREATDVVVHVRDVAYGPSLEESVFVLPAPKNAILEVLGPGGCQ